MIFVDSGAWFATFVPADRRHAEASRWMAQNRDDLITTDYVIDETLTLLRARGERSRAITAATRFFLGELATIHYLTEGDIRAASEVFRRYADKSWSFTDCTSKAVIDRLLIPAAFAFDLHFRQFGTVQVVP